MALYSGISVMAFLAFATLLGFAQGLKCYSCIKSTNRDPKDNKPVMIEVYKNDCEVTFGDMVEVPKESDVCVKKEGKVSYDGKTTHTHEVRTHGKAGGWQTPDAGCKDYPQRSPDPEGQYTICVCKDKDGCNAVAGFGSDVNVILGFGAIALFLGYLRQ